MDEKILLALLDVVKDQLQNTAKNPTERRMDKLQMQFYKLYDFVNENTEYAEQLTVLFDSEEFYIQWQRWVFHCGIVADKTAQNSHMRLIHDFTDGHTEKAIWAIDYWIAYGRRYPFPLSEETYSHMPKRRKQKHSYTQVPDSIKSLVKSKQV